jgi:hypothetical protein
MGYYLADGIYPNWSTFVKTIKAPVSLKVKHFATAQEAQRKDVECAFGVLHARFQIVHQPARLWDETTLQDIMTACIIMHNMILEDERDLGRIESSYERGAAETRHFVSHAATSDFVSFVKKHEEIHNSQFHYQLKNDLVEHLWQRPGQRQ